MDMVGYETTKELAEATINNSQSVIENINKMFENNTISTRIYIHPSRISKIKLLCVFLKHCIIINETLDIRLISSEVIQAQILSLDSQTVNTDDTNGIMKQLCDKKMS